MNRVRRCACWSMAVLGLSLFGLACARPRPPARAAPAPRATAPVRAPAPAPTPTTSWPTPRPTPAEIRGVWISNTELIDWDSATRDLQSHGFNSIYVNLASGGAAFYPSQVLPRAPGSDGDPFARGIQLAHQRGLAVHAKLIALFLFKSPKEFQRRLVATNRVMRGPDGKPIEQAGFNWLCPSQEANRALLAAVTTELVRRYPVDGLHLDYIRFCELPSCYCNACRHAFEHQLGQPVPGWPAAAVDGPYASRFRQWKINLINDRVHELATLARQSRPGLVVSAAVFHNLARAREEKAQDWQAWLTRGDVDYVCTMSYAPRLAEFEAMIAGQQRAADRRRLVIGIGSWKLDRRSDLTAQIKAVRRTAAPGFVLFSYDDAAARNFLPQFATGQ